MRRIVVNLRERSYDVIIQHGAIAHAGDLIRERMEIGKEPRSPMVVVTDEPTASCWLEPLRQSLVASGFLVRHVVIPPGERQKNMWRLEWLCERMLEMGIERSGTVVALGGGVIGDLAGFAAAIYMRGIDFVQIPTSLIAQVDSSIGGKVAVNLPSAKNTVGAFHQPKLVIIDPQTLTTLPDREFKAGMAEVIKCAIIGDEMLFRILREETSRITSRDMDVIEVMIARCASLKARVVEEDEREHGLRIILNYGHTIGHALEAEAESVAAVYQRTYPLPVCDGGHETGVQWGHKKEEQFPVSPENLRHGEAVAVGMRCAVGIAWRMGLCSSDLVSEHEGILDVYGLPWKVTGVAKSAVLERMMADKKRKAGVNRFILPVRIGRVIIRDDVPLNIIEDVLSEVGCA